MKIFILAFCLLATQTSFANIQQFFSKIQPISECDNYCEYTSLTHKYGFRDGTGNTNFGSPQLMVFEDGRFSLIYRYGRVGSIYDFKGFDGFWRKVSDKKIELVNVATLETSGVDGNFSFKFLIEPVQDAAFPLRVRGVPLVLNLKKSWVEFQQPE